MAEGLTLVDKVVSSGLFHGYKVGDNLDYSVVQFADNTILTGKAPWGNLWSITSILRSFDLYPV